MFAVLVRGSAMALIGAIGVLWLALLWRNRRDRTGVWRLIGKGLVIPLVGIAVVVIAVRSVPHEYVKEGRLGTVFWHRVFESVGINPEWPYHDPDGSHNVNELFDCKKYIPEGLLAGVPDRNGHCVYWDYATRHNIPEDVVVRGTYGGRYYEPAVREAFLKIVRNYPRQILVTFLYYKPAYILWSMGVGLSFSVSSYPPLAIALLVAALGSLAAFSIWGDGISIAAGKRIAGLTLLLAAFTTIPYFAVWAMLHTAADLLLLIIFFAGLAASVALTTARSALWRGRSARSCQDGARHRVT